MVPIKDLNREVAQDIRYILMDIDDTITTNGKLPAAAYSALWKLHNNGFVVVPVTGRPAGWCDLIARQWPVDGVVGENGALAFWEEEGHMKRMFHENAVNNTHHTLQEIKEKILLEIPGTRIAGDQFSRMFDIAIDFAEEEPKLPLTVAQKIKEMCTNMGAIAKVSSIHVNTWMGQYDKLSMAIRFLEKQCNYNDKRDNQQVLFFGDSPNDEPMFSHFQQSVGVASILDYKEMMKILPTYITSFKGGEGFSEGVDTLLSAKGITNYS